MSDITLEKIYALLEKLTHYVMTEFPAIKENVDRKTENVLPAMSCVKYDDDLCKKLDMCLDLMNRQANMLEEMRTYMQSVHRTLAKAEKRRALLKQLGHL